MTTDWTNRCLVNEVLNDQNLVGATSQSILKLQIQFLIKAYSYTELNHLTNTYLRTKKNNEYVRN